MVALSGFEKRVLAAGVGHRTPSAPARMPGVSRRPSEADSAPGDRSCTDTWATTGSPGAKARSCRARSGWSGRSPPSAVEASAIFDELVALHGPLGLFAEEMDPAIGDHLGIFPWAPTHAALLRAAGALDAPTTKAEPARPRSRS